jgi:hypothetical protein
MSPPSLRMTSQFDDNFTKRKASVRRAPARRRSSPEWSKWRPNDPAPAAWYDIESFSRLIAAEVAHDQDHGRDRTVRDFIEEFRGLVRTDTRAQILDVVSAARMSLREFFTKPKSVAKLLELMKLSTKPVVAKDLGLLGKEHFNSIGPACPIFFICPSSSAIADCRKEFAVLNRPKGVGRSSSSG